MVGAQVCGTWEVGSNPTELTTFINSCMEQDFEYQDWDYENKYSKEKSWVTKTLTVQTGGGGERPAARGHNVDKVVTSHGCSFTTTTAACSNNVRAMGTGIVRAGDANQVHTVPAGSSCVPHTATLSSYSKTVRVNKRGAGRIADKYGKEIIVSGASTVRIGG